MKNLNVGMIGCGVVGQGVMQILAEHHESILGRLGCPIEVRRIAVRGDRDRGPHVQARVVSQDVEALLDDEGLDLVVEVMGGVETAGEYVRRALTVGRPVVTANKALIADQGHELISLAEEQGVDLYFEAAVAGGVPVLRMLREALASDRILAMRGIINGTSNYIMSRMREEPGLEFAAALEEAQAAGYAEADPSLDVGGGDAAHKLAILATLAYGARFDPDAITTEGIDMVSAVDMVFAKRFGFVIKPLAIARELSSGALDLRVHPALVSQDNPLAAIGGALNALAIDGAAVGPCILSGLGAGALPTATSVVSDMIDVGRNLMSGASGRVPQRAVPGHKVRARKVQNVAEHHCRFYLRFSVLDRSGVLGRIASALGRSAVSIEQMVQEGHGSDDPVAIVVLTHPAREGDVRAALAEIDVLDDVVHPTTVLRIAED